MENARCLGLAPENGETEPDIFFPEQGQTMISNEAIVACFHCPVRAECDDYKKRTNTEYGIWAGKFSKRNEGSGT